MNILPQLLNPIDEVDVERLINDDDWLAQQKQDGERRLLVKSGNDIIGINKKGNEVSLPNEIINSINFACDFILDGEIIGNTFHVFDLLMVNDQDLKTIPCVDRLKYLQTFNFGSHIKIVETAYTTRDKRILFDILKRENAEGIVFKRKNSTYKSGRPNSGGDQLKFKFQKSGTFIVKDHTTGKRSVGLDMLNDKGKRVFLGKTTIPPNKEIPAIGSFVEVQYLYAFKGGAIFQPVYLKERFDCDLTDVNISQLVYKQETEE